MKKLHFIIIGISISLSLSSCDSNFEEVNEDPNRLAEISPATILNPILYGLADHNADRSWSVNFDLMQVTLPFPSVSGGLHRYDVSLGVGNSSYYWYYRWANNISELQEAADNVKNRLFKEGEKPYRAGKILWIVRQYIKYTLLAAIHGYA
ncbi:hypothetical protein LCGC14_2378510, partial [marine sediment metagenome]